MRILKPNFIALAGAGLALLTSMPARANIILNIQSVMASVGTNNGTFEVSLTNSGATAIDISAFTFNISTTDADISFVDATDATTPDPYIFPVADSFDAQLAGGDLLPNPPNSGQNFTGNVPSDLTFNGDNVTVAAGATVGLGEVFFDLAPNATLGPATISFVQDASTSLANTSGGLTIDQYNPGTLTIVGAVPEPRLSILVALAAAVMLRRWKTLAARATR